MPLGHSARALLEALAVEKRVDEGEHLAFLSSGELLHSAEPPVEARIWRLRARSTCGETEELISGDAEGLGDRRHQLGGRVLGYYSMTSASTFMLRDQHP